MKKNKSCENYISIRRLKKLGAEVIGRQVYVTDDCFVGKGAKLFSPCYVARGSRVGAGAVVYPFSYIEGSTVGIGAVIRSSTVADSAIGENVTVGPYAYVRGGAEIGRDCRIGDFVEIKNSRLGRGCKAAHLSYVGDATLGERVNVGCGVVFANYDGKKKRRSVVGDDCFIGCNSNLVAPVNVGRGAYIAAGTTLTRDLGELSFCIGRCRELVSEGGAAGRYHNEDGTGGI